MFVTLCLDDSTVETTRRFYQRLGLAFSKEQHGDRGLIHYAAVLPGVPVEIYPTIKGLPSEDKFFIGFAVENPASLLAELVEYYGGSYVMPPVQTTVSGIVTLRDPNGVLIRLFPGEQGRVA